MRCVFNFAYFLAVASAFQGSCYHHSRTLNPLSMMKYPNDGVSRRSILDSTLQGSLIAAALVSAGAPPALAADIAQQVKQIEKENRDTANTNGAPEKHIPQVKVSNLDSQSGINSVKVTVPHVMDAEKPHWIQAIWLQEEKSGDVAVAKVLPATEPSPPTLTCGASKGARLTPMCYCNLHGLWVGETFTV